MNLLARSTPPTPEAARWRDDLGYARRNVADARASLTEVRLFALGAAEAGVDVVTAVADAGILVVRAGYRRARAVTTSE